MNFATYKCLVYSDLYRYAGKVTRSIYWQNLIENPGFKYSFFMRTCFYASQNAKFRRTVFPFAKMMLEHYKFKYGIDIEYWTRIGSGFYIGHFMGIVVHCDTIIGKNCNISQGVTIGQTNRGERMGTPVIGDNVYIGPGAKIIGKIKIGSNVAIGANSVVTRDVPDNAVVVGVPGRVISFKGAEGYITNTGY